MVNRINLATLLLPVCLYSFSAANAAVPIYAAKLSVELSEPTIELGKGLNVQIRYTGDGQVAQANLERWQTDFYIDRRRSTSEQLHDGSVETTETVRLYPRREGTLTLYSLALGGAISEPVDLIVERPVRNNIDGTPVWQTQPAQIWQGETLTNCVEMPLFDSRNNMKLEAPEFDAIRVAALNAEVIETASVSIARQCWQLTASRPGIYSLELPPVIQRGRGSWSFYLPKQTIEILPLPSYLPPAVPVGEPKVNASLEQERWQLRLQLSDPQAAEAYGVRAELAKLSSIDSDEVSVSFESDSQTLQQVQLFEATLPVWSWGFGSGERINLRYFDTELGMLKSTEVSVPTVWRAPLWFIALLTSMFLLIVILLGRKALKVCERVLTRHKFKQAVNSCKSPEQLRQLLLQQTGNKTLESWAKRSGIDHAQQFANALNALCFSVNTGDGFSKLKATLLKQI